MTRPTVRMAAKVKPTMVGFICTYIGSSEISVTPPATKLVSAVMIAISANCRKRYQVAIREMTVATIMTAVETQKPYSVLARKNRPSGMNSNTSLIASLVDDEKPLSTR